MADQDRPPSNPSKPRAAEPGDELSFEEALDRLETIVERLEDGELALEEALSGFEEGVRLSRGLADRLGDAERRIERLTREGGVLATRPLADDEEAP